LIGSAGFSRRQRRTECHEGVLFGMAVSDAFQGQGIGKRLVEALIEEARACEQLLQIELHVSEGNERALRLYRSCGFEAYGRKPRATIVDGADIAKILMILAITPR
jgi:ribosomal protein S18 acetylase RimI-like enzyme